MEAQRGTYGGNVAWLWLGEKFGILESRKGEMGYLWHSLS